MSLILLFRLVVGIAFVAYIYCMFIDPFLERDWNHVLNTWKAWQSLNAGALAFSASIIAFYVTKYRTIQQQEKEFIAARAFLPGAFDELCTYFQESANFYLELNAKTNSLDPNEPQSMTTAPPLEPVGYKDVFREGIKAGKDDVANYLSEILYKIQIHHARMKGEYQRNSPVRTKSNTIIGNMYCLGELQALVDNNFDFARGLSEFDVSTIDAEKMKVAYYVLNFRVELIDGLADYTQRHTQVKK